MTYDESRVALAALREVVVAASVWKCGVTDDGDGSGSRVILGTDHCFSFTGNDDERNRRCAKSIVALHNTALPIIDAQAEEIARLNRVIDRIAIAVRSEALTTDQSGMDIEYIVAAELEAREGKS